jgi:hypothetical protein
MRKQSLWLILVLVLAFASFGLGSAVSENASERACFAAFVHDEQARIEDFGGNVSTFARLLRRTFGVATSTRASTCEPFSP